MKSNYDQFLAKFEVILLNFIAATGVFFSPVIGVFVAIGSFVILDTCFGWWKAKKTNGETPTSEKLRKGIIPKSLSYLAFVISFYLLDRFMINPLLFHKFGTEYLLTKLISLFLVIVEMISIDEKWKAVKGESMLIILKKIIKTSKDIFKDIKSFNSPKKGS